MRHTPIEIRRASKVIAEELRERILYGEWRNELRLAPEPELAEKLGLSRHHFREALRLLERDGLIESRRGHTGGIFLTVPRPEVFARTMEGIIARTHVTVVDVLAAATDIHSRCAELATVHATTSELEDVAKFLDAISTEGGSLAGCGPRFQELVAEVGHNQTLQLITLALSPLLRHIYSTVEYGLFSGWERRIQATGRAILARDASRAQKIIQGATPYLLSQLNAAGFDVATHTMADSMMLAASPRSGSQTRRL